MVQADREFRSWANYRRPVVDREYCDSRWVARVESPFLPSSSSLFMHPIKRRSQRSNVSRCLDALAVECIVAITRRYRRRGFVSARVGIRRGYVNDAGAISRVIHVSVGVTHD